MNFAQLRAFHAVAQHGTFSAAAHALSVSQPAITQHVRALEEAIGGRLFHRRGTGVELTADGNDLLPHVHQIIKGFEDVSARLEDGKQLRIGHLAIGLCGPHVAMPLIRQFRASHPGVQIETRMNNSSQLLELVTQLRVDLAVVTLPAPANNLVCHKLADQEVLLLVPAEHEWALRDAIDIAELEALPFVLREHGSMTQRIFDTALTSRDVSIQRELELSSREAVKEAVAVGLGLGVVLDKELGHDSRLAGVKLTGADLAAAEYLVAHPEVSELGAVREFIATSLSTTANPAPTEAL
ncbi:Transcriptional regulator, LysR family protein [Devosia sp. LC5]|uniref:LysR substrate-binding domain-containing protein n=1 Tax=Devosia sp. LC5 TaxID=1502724 RepID=UPI0004E31020|nr:LysR substrate-binding domain-containing protein [Devosia sp. LC5]KFC68214.1 Transcriptional regulator, LysR family protein [Devosia sp. LC5]